jgi:hypothetical protein
MNQTAVKWVLSDSEWGEVAAMLPVPNPKGGPYGNREILEAIIWIACHKVTWAALPAHFPVYQSVSVSGRRPASSNRCWSNWGFRCRSRNGQVQKSAYPGFPRGTRKGLAAGYLPRHNKRPRATPGSKAPFRRKNPRTGEVRGRQINALLSCCECPLFRQDQFFKSSHCHVLVPDIGFPVSGLVVHLFHELQAFELPRRAPSLVTGLH